MAGTLLAPTAQAVDPAIQPKLMVSEKDSVTGVGLVTYVYNVAVNNVGTTYVEVDTDNTNTNIDGAILKDGLNLYIQEGDPVLAPPLSGVNTFDAFQVNDSGNTAWNCYLELSTTPGTSSQEAVYFNNQLIVDELVPVAWPGVTPGTMFMYFGDVKINNNDEVLVAGYCDDPTITGTSEYFLMKVDALTGAQTKLVMEGDPAPGTTETFLYIGYSGETYTDFNDKGDYIFYGYLTGPTTQDYVIYMNNKLLAREGDPGPIAGRTWYYISGADCGLNNKGDYVFHAGLDTSVAENYLIVKNGEVYMMEGDTLPAFAPYKITSFGSGKTDISDHGDVFWYADWDDTTTQDEGVFVNDKLILQEGVSTVNGMTITQIDGSAETQAMSNDGRYYQIEVEYMSPAGELEGTVLIDRGPWDILEGGTKGTNGVPMLRGWGSLEAGSTVTVDLSYARPNSLAYLFVGGTAINAPFMCGTCVPAPDFVLFAGAVDANGNISFTTTLPTTPTPGAAIYMQAVIGDPQGCNPFVLSNAVKGNLQ